MRTARGGHSASVGTTALSLLRVGLYSRVWLFAAVATVFAGAFLVSPPEANADARRLSPSAYDAAFSTYDPTPSAVLGSSETGSRRESPNPEVLATPGAYVSIPSVGVAANAGRGADFIASADGVVVPTSRSRMVGTFEEVGLPSSPTTSAGTQYTLPDGSLVRVIEPSGQAPLRASFTNANGGPVSPFTGKPVQPPSGLSKADRLDYIRSRTHIELGK